MGFISSAMLSVEWLCERLRLLMLNQMAITHTTSSTTTPITTPTMMGADDDEAEATASEPAVFELGTVCVVLLATAGIAVVVVSVTVPLVVVVVMSDVAMVLVDDVVDDGNGGTVKFPIVGDV